MQEMQTELVHENYEYVRYYWKGERRCLNLRLNQG